MRRRPRPDDDPTPVRLRRFVPAEWGTDDPLDAAPRWYAARDEWAAQTGLAPSTVEGIVWPDERFDRSEI